MLTPYTATAGGFVGTEIYLLHLLAESIVLNIMADKTAPYPADSMALLSLLSAYLAR